MKFSIDAIRRIFLTKKDLTPEELQSELEKLREGNDNEFDFDETSVEFLDANLQPIEDSCDDFTIELKIDDLGRVQMQTKPKEKENSEE